MDIDIKNLKRYKYDNTIIRGIYYLFNKGELVYIGQSDNILKRINQHTDKQFDEFSYIEVNKDIGLDDIEKDEIRKYKPKLNKNLYDKTTKNRLSALFNLIRRLGYRIPNITDRLLCMDEDELCKYIRENTGLDEGYVKMLVSLNTTEINGYRKAIGCIM